MNKLRLKFEGIVKIYYIKKIRFVWANSEQLTKYAQNDAQK